MMMPTQPKAAQCLRVTPRPKTAATAAAPTCLKMMPPQAKAPATASAFSAAKAPQCLRVTPAQAKTSARPPTTPSTPLSRIASRPPLASSTPLTPRPKAVVDSGSMGRAPLTPGPGTSSASGGFAAPIRKRPQDDEEVDAPMAPKRPPPLKQQIESYFSNEGLKQDRHLYDLVAQGLDGWVDVDDVLVLRQVKALRAKRDDIVRALRGSWLEVFVEDDGSYAAIRRPSNMPLPTWSQLEQTRNARPGQQPVVAIAKTNSAKPSSSLPAKPKAAETTGKPATMLFPGRLRGNVIAYEEGDGSMLVACPQVKALFQRDVVIDWRELERAGAAVRIGSAVSFKVALGPNGEPLAQELELTADDDADGGTAAKKRKVAAASSGAQDEVLAGRRYMGVIKSFHAGIGLGFISCRETHLTFGRDVAVSQVEIGGFCKGDTVSFLLGIDADLGTPQATVLESAGRDAGQTNKGHSQLESGLFGCRYSGRIKSFNSDIGVGMIATVGGSKLLGRDVAVVEAQLAGFTVGDVVSFQLSAEKGALKATDLEAEDE